jgi:signal transduction histidine kinase
LAGGVAHDFNNLLSVVLTLADLARGHLPPEHPVYADLRRISEAGEQAAALASQLLALSRRRAVAGQEHIEVNRVVRRTLELLRATLPDTLQVKADLAETPLIIRADETQLQQVVMNLCLNARDAMPEGGVLCVATALEGGGADNGVARVRLSVEDSGVGMSEQVRARIFEPFFTTKESTGLGLAVVQQIIESQGGRVEVASQPGQGARFDVWWPAGEPPGGSSRGNSP